MIQASLYRLFQDRARQQRDAVAVSVRDRNLTYGQLDRAVDRLAALLSDGDERKVVGVYAPPSPEAVVAILAALKRGATYLPIDPSMSAAAEPACDTIVVKRDLLTRAETLDIPCICAPDPWSEREEGHFAIHSQRPSRDHAACLLASRDWEFGQQLLMLEHRSVLSGVMQAARTLDIENAITVLSLADIGDPMFLLELFLPLTVGGSIRFLSSPLFAGRRYDHDHDTALFIHSSAIEALSDSGHVLEHLQRLVVMDADASSADLKTLLAELTDVRVYGAISQAETSGWTGGFRWREGHVNLFPIAQDAQVDTLSVLGPDLQRMPPGVEGDVYGAGPSLARGYVSSEPTPDRFVMHPETGARLFATGYLGRYESAGIRITRDRSRRTWYRGRYVSLDALESRLAEHPSVERAIVTDEHALVAELTLRDESESIDLADVQRQLGAAIPEGLPLRCVVARKRISGANDTIQTTTEEAVAMIWTAILGRQQIGAQENFFDLGANSFVASLVCANVATEFGITLSVVDIYNHPNLRSLSARIDDLAAGQAPSA